MQLKLLKSIKKEHSRLKGALKEIISHSNKKSKINQKTLKEKCNNLENIWDEHEKKEDLFFKNMPQKYETFLLNQHKSLKGHWFVINLILKSGNENNLRVALDTDGRMLQEKFLNHLDHEEKVFEKLVN